MYNTPNTFGIWVIKLVAEHVLELGGLAAMDAENQRKADLLYSVIDEHPLCTGHASADSRSLMNVTFRMENPEQEQAFLERCSQANMIGLKGHRSVGGLRASIYNAVPSESVAHLCETLRHFRG